MGCTDGAVYRWDVLMELCRDRLLVELCTDGMY